MARRRSESMLILHTAHRAALRSMILRDAHGVGHLAAVLVDHRHKLLGHGGGAVEHDGESGQALGRPPPGCQSAAGWQRPSRCGCTGGCELVSAVAGADGDGQGIARRCLVDELLHLFGVGCSEESSAETLTSSSTPARAPSSASTTTPWSWAYSTTFLVISMFSSKGLERAVDHHGGEAAVDAGLAELKVCRRGPGAGRWAGRSHRRRPPPA